MTSEVESSRAVPVFLFRAVPEKMTLMCFIYQLMHLSWKIKLFHLVTGIHQRCFFFSRPFTGPLSFFAGCIMIASIVLGLGFFWRQSTQKKGETWHLRKSHHLHYGDTPWFAVGKRNSWRATRLEGWLHQPSVCSELHWSWDSNQFNVLSNGLWFLGWFMLYKCHYAWE